MRRNIIVLGLVTVLVCLCAAAYLAECEQQALASRLIRLHIVASSDAPEAQERKLAVRDAVLPVVASVTASCKNKQDAAAALRLSLPELSAAAANKLTELGCSEAVTVTLAYECFPRRNYDTFSLPAGRYETLRLTLGEGKGHNWWCVAFPSLCLPATSEGFVQAAELAGFSQEQTDLLSGDSFPVELKFRLLDWLSSLFG